MIATGAINSIASALNTGAAKRGAPSHAAAAIGPRSIGLPQPRPLVSTA